MTEQLPAAARDFLDGPATAEGLAGLAALPRPLLDRLVAELYAARARTHLELIGASQLPSAVRKLARRHAYQLKSRGVAAAPTAHTARVDGSAAIDLREAALAVSPGLYGRYWLLLGGLFGVASAELRGGEAGAIAQVEVLPPLSAGRLRKTLAQATDGTPEAQGLIFPCGANLAVRLIDSATAGLRAAGGAFPPGWSAVVQWREAALRAGADPAAADARALLGGDAVRGASWRDSADLLGLAVSGSHVPPRAVVNRVLAAAMEAAEGAAEGSRALLMRVADEACDAWLAEPAARARVAHLLEAVADVVHDRGVSEAAARFLRIADALRDTDTAASEVGFLSATFRRLVDHELARSLYPAAPDPSDEPETA